MLTQNSSAEFEYLVLHDFLTLHGGAESVVFTLLRDLDQGQLITGWIDEETFSAPKGLDDSIVALTSPSSIRGLQLVKSWRAFAKMNSNDLPAPTVIFSGISSLAAVYCCENKNKIYYCHSIPRFLYDLRGYWMGRLSLPEKIAFRALEFYLKPRYENALNEISVLVSNSDNVRNRTLQFLGLDSQVIYPPCDVASYRWNSQSDYYLSTARLEPFKRVDEVVRAFLKLPHLKLVIASGGSEYDSLRKLAAEAKNISFVGWLGKAELVELVSNAIACIYIPIDEDFGISPVEAMAAGKPVIGSASGGLKETVIDGQTGYLVGDISQPSVNHGIDMSALCAAILMLDPESAYQMKEDCENNAQRFSEQRFIAEIKQLY